MTKHIRTDFLQVLAPRFRNAVFPPFRYRRRLDFAQAGRGVCAAKEINNDVCFFIHNDHHKAYLTPMQGKPYGAADKLVRMETWHDRLQMALDARGLDWPDLVTATGKTKPSVYAWKPTATKQTKMIEGENAAKVCALLRINSDWLFSGKGQSGLEAQNITKLPTKMHPAILEIIELMENTDDAGKWKAVGAAKNELASHRPTRKHRAN